MKNHFALGLCLLGVTIGAHAQLFYDSFTRAVDPGILSPWTAQSGNWTVTGGVFQSGLNPTINYANATITNNFTNCTVQARLKFPAGAFGGGVAGRMNPATGARYSAWVYPEGSPGGSSVIRLIKFQDYSGFGYQGVSGSAIQTASLASVGTGFHTVRLDFQTNRISVFFDNSLMIVTNDIDTQYYTNGAVGLEMWTDSAGYVFTADDVVVNNFGLLAGNDSFTAASGSPFTAPAPGVLANDTGGGAPLNATLVTGAIHGILNLSSNGGFNYTATNGFTGTDTFTYRANDGFSNSTTATVTLTVTPNHAPVAVADAYTVQVGSMLNVSAPGVLANDTDVDGNALTATLLSSTTSGSLSFSNNGAFVYTPNVGFVGSDSFTYRASDGISNSASATVSISVSPPAIFSDDFTRGTDPGPLTPWIAQSGLWTVTGGQMKGGTNSSFNYGFVIETNGWTNYTVQAKVKFSAGAFGGGVGGRLNPTTGAHYAAWVYPEASGGGSNILRLIKFQNYNNFSYNGVGGAVMQQVNLASVGTNFHTVKLAFFGSQIAVYFDGSQMMSAADTDTGGAPYLNGAVSLDFWTDAAGTTFTADDVVVNFLVTDDNYLGFQNTALVVPAPGILADDTSVFSTNLTSALAVPPSHGSVSVNTSGGFTYTPTTNYVGADSFAYSDSDAGNNLGTATVNLSITALNTAPTLPAQTNRTIAELTPLTVTNTATDADIPPQTLTYSLVTPPTGLLISSNGVITWTPTEAQGPGTYSITSIVTDNGFPQATATNSFQVTVTEVNNAPVLPVQTNRTINELTALSVANGATDSDLPANALTYSFLDAPTGAAISASGQITWTPTEAQGPSTNIFTTRVADSGSPTLSATNSFTVVVNEVNVTPVLPAQTNRTIPAQTLLTLTNTATDADLPANVLTYTLLAAPTNAAISASGIITWTPSIAQNQSTNLFRTWVKDDGTPSLNATNTFTVFVNSNPVVVLDSTAMILEGCTPTNNAIDPGETVTMTFTVRNTGTGPTTNLVLTLLNSNGVASASGPVNYGVLPAGGSLTQPFTFSAVGSCGGNITPTLQFKEGSLSLGSSNVTYPLGGIVAQLTQNFDTVTAPALPAAWSTASSGAQSNWVTSVAVRDTVPNAAFCPDVPGIGTNVFLSPPITVPGLPALLTFLNNYSFEGTSVTGYDGGVLEIRIGTNAFVDILASGATFVSGGYNRTLSSIFGNPLAGRQAWSSSSTGFVTTTVNLPASVAGQVVQFRWVCGTDTDNNGGGGAGWRIDTVSVSARTCCANTAPALTDQPDRVINELTALTVTNTASDSSTASSGLNYHLENPPAGAFIDTNGIITWTPNEAQGPGTNIITTVVTDNAFPPLSATNSFQVIVMELNSAPVFPAQTNITVAELSQLIVTNTAIDSDIPANQVAYQLIDPPAGVAIDANGIISWIPTESQGPGLYVITTVATDDAVPPLSATNSFQVSVTEVNSAPVLPVPTNVTVAELSLLIFTNTAIDSDIPANQVAYQLIAPPAGVTIDTNGIVSWTPTESQGPGLYIISTVATDDGVPPLSATNSFQVSVTEVNSAPVLPVQANVTIAASSHLLVTNSATDADLPANNLTYQLAVSPSGASIDATGLITWTAGSAASTNDFKTIVTDDGVPPLTATNVFQVTVTAAEVLPPPVIESITVFQGEAVLIWSSISNHTYRVQYLEQIDGNSWSNLVPDVTATAATSALTNSVGDAATRYYRVILLP